jgi:nucleotide-binding universal stress UspA family protein
MKKIIAPTDFSSASENACMYAANLAADIKAELLLFHIIELPVSIAEYAVTDELFDEAGVEKELENLKNKLCAATNNEVIIKTKDVLGFAVNEIAELCNRVKPFAVVMSTNISNLYQYFFKGSTTVYTAKHLFYPVIIVPHNTKYQPLKKIAFACDLKDIYEIPVTEIETIVKLFNSELDIFYAAKNENVINRHAIDNLLLNHRLEHLNPQFYVVQDDNVWKGIKILAKKHAADMLIIVSKKHNPFHKSQTKDFVIHTDRPVMVIHEEDRVAKKEI